ncbi:MAG: hypothetical protein JXB24_15090, partial [Bacteroidales bacterium]|nr:hypothetical protein [Bacteroidales bacterium]
YQSFVNSLRLRDFVAILKYLPFETASFLLIVVTDRNTTEDIRTSSTQSIPRQQWRYAGRRICLWIKAQMQSTYSLGGIF